MLDKTNLTEDNFFDFAVSGYTNIHCKNIGEFKEDLLLLKYLKRLFNKYLEIGEMSPGRLRLSLNHLIIFFNVFERYVAIRLLYYKMDPILYPILKTFLVFLNLQPKIIHGICGRDIETMKIKIDENIMKQLESL
jgi:hypothetical protein